MKNLRCSSIKLQNQCTFGGAWLPRGSFERVQVYQLRNQDLDSTSSLLALK